MKVAVLDTNKQPLAPCHPAMARKLLSRGEAAVFRRAPFTVIFDLQLMENPEIEGVEYQQGELAGYDLREYLLLKFGHQCVYRRDESPCDEYLEVEHLIPRSRGGSNRVSNLAIACHKHNQEKGDRTAAEYGFPEVEARAKKSLKDAAAVNATRWALFNRLKGVGLPIETGSGGLTKFNRTQRGLPKTHWIDAACVGHSTPEKIDTTKIKPLRIKAVGHNSRQMCRMDKYGFPRTSAKASRTIKLWQPLAISISSPSKPSGASPPDSRWSIHLGFR